MRDITFFIGPFGSGGGERNCCNLANAFVKNGVDVTVVAIGVRDPLFLKRFDTRVKFISLERKHLRHAFIPMLRYLLNNKPSKVLAFNHYIGTALQLIRMYFGLSYELYMRNIVGLTKKYEMNTSFWQAKVSRIFVEKMLQHVDGVISQCVAMAEDLTRNWGIPKDKLTVIYNPVAEEVERNLQAWSRNGKEQEILFVGRLSSEKGVHVLLESLKSLAGKFPDLKLRLLGEGPLEQELKNISEKLGIREKVIFQGYVADPIPYYKKALITALPSFSEGFPNVLIESITLGTPVVAFDCETGPAEIIKNDFNGYLVELGNISDFTNAIEKAISKDWSFRVEEYRLEPIARKYMEFLGL